MTNRFLTDADLDLLAHPGRWRFADAPGRPAARAAARARWSLTHAHSHGHAEMLIVLRGRGWFGMGSRLFPAGNATLFLLPPGTPHDNGYPPGTAAADHLWISLLPGCFTVMRTEIRGGRWTSAEASRCLLRTAEAGIDPLVFLRLAARADEAGPGGRALAAAQAMLWKVAEAGGRPASADAGEEDFQAGVIRAIERHLQETAGRGDKLATLAQIAGYSKFHFLRVFQKRTGLSVHDYIDRCRKHKATALLGAGRSRTEVARVLGFSCLPAFSRWARRHLG